MIDLLSSNKALIAKIKSTAERYSIDPIHMIGAIARLSVSIPIMSTPITGCNSNYVKAVSYADNSFRFGYKDEIIAQFLTHSQFIKCQSKKDS